MGKKGWAQALFSLGGPNWKATLSCDARQRVHNSTALLRGCVHNGATSVSPSALEAQRVLLFSRSSAGHTSIVLLVCEGGVQLNTGALLRDGMLNMAPGWYAKNLFRETTGPFE